MGNGNTGFGGFDTGAYVERLGGTSSIPDAPLPFYNVKDYGAKGDGTTDDAAAIQAAINAAGQAGGGQVWFPLGVYLISTTLNLNNNAVQLVGVSPSFPFTPQTSLDNRPGSIIAPTTTFTAGDYLVVCNSSGLAANQVGGCGVRDLTFLCNSGGVLGAAHLSGGLRAYAPEFFTVERVVVVNPHNAYGIRCEAVGSSGDSARVLHCFVEGSGDGVADSSQGGIFNSVYEGSVIGCEAIQVAAAGTLHTDGGIVASNSVKVIGCVVDTSALDAYVLTGASALVGCSVFSNAGNNGAYLMNDGNSVIGCYFPDCGNANSGGYSGAAILVDNGKNAVAGNVIVAGSYTSYGIYDNGTPSEFAANVISGTFTSAPTFAVAPQANIGSNAGTGASVSVSGSDHTGTVTCNTGTAPAAGNMVGVAFAAARTYAPRVYITPENGLTAGSTAGFYVSDANISNSGFVISSANAPGASTAYTWRYQCVWD